MLDKQNYENSEGSNIEDRFSPRIVLRQQSKPDSDNTKELLSPWW